jgi:hypothetical protein
MAAPAGQSCANCAFFVSGECRRESPLYVRTGDFTISRWSTVEAGEWCSFWNVWPEGGGMIGTNISSGTAAPTGGVDGDFYVKYTFDGTNTYITALSIYQKQAGTWNVITTIL